MDMYTAMRKKDLPELPERKGYRIITRRIPHPSPSFKGFYLWERRYWDITPLSTALEILYGDAIRRQITEDFTGFQMIKKDTGRDWQGGTITIPLKWKD